MVTKLGMSDYFGMMALETSANPYLGGDSTLNCAPETARKVDEEVIEIIKHGHDTATNIIKQNIAKLHELAEYLLDKETITGDEFMRILNYTV